MDDSVSRFRDRYLSKTRVYKVPERARQWVVRRVEDWQIKQSIEALRFCFFELVRPTEPASLGGWF